MGKRACLIVYLEAQHAMNVMRLKQMQECLQTEAETAAERVCNGEIAGCSNRRYLNPDIYQKPKQNQA
jgi:hypothetical protein